jgi:hypothetical protein
MTEKKFGNLEFYHRFKNKGRERIKATVFLYLPNNVWAEREEGGVTILDFPYTRTCLYLELV